MTEPLQKSGLPSVRDVAGVEADSNDKEISESYILSRSNDSNSSDNVVQMQETMKDTFVESLVPNRESNSQRDALLQNQDNIVNDGDENLNGNYDSSSNTANNSDEKELLVIHTQSGHINDDYNLVETIPESSFINVNSNGIYENCDSKAYTVSIDSDDDQKVQRIPLYRDDLIEDSDDSDSSDSDTSSTVSDDNEDSDIISIRSSDKSDSEDKKSKKATRTKGELSLQDLPPIEDLKISIDENKCKPVGCVLNIVDEMVVIQSFPNTPPLDIDTVLFLDRGQRALGKIFDVFGPVHEPFYSIRFNSRGHIQEKNVRREQVVYCAPQTEYTSYIPVAELLKEKGSDASWTNNNEPPLSCVDYSDDEEEARHKRPKVPVGTKRDVSADNDLFVKKMNQKNLELTAKRRKEDEAAKQKRSTSVKKVIASSNNHTAESLLNPVHSYAPFTDAYKLKSRTFSSNSNNDQPSSTSYYHPAAAVVNTHGSKFESTPRAINYLRNAAASFASPLSYTFPSQHFMCSSPRQLPNTHQPSAAAQNYLAMFQRPPMPTTAPMPPPFTNFTGASIPPMPTFVTQPSMHPNIPPSFNASVPPPPPFGNYNPPLPSSLPQPNFFPRTDAGAAVHQPAFISLNMQPGVPTTFHPQFVLPPPPPPPPPVTLSHQTHQRDVCMGSRSVDRRTQQSSHQTSNSYYPKSPSNS